MTRRLIVALAVLGSGLVLLAGCGSSSKTTSTTVPATSSTPASGSSTSSTSSTTSSTPDTSTVQAAVEECKNIIKAENKLSQGAKEKLEGACSEAAKGNTSIVKKVAREVCEETIKNSTIPQSDKEEAIATCRKN